MVLGVWSDTHSEGGDVCKECHHACRCPRVENAAPNLICLKTRRSRTMARWCHCAYARRYESGTKRAAHVRCDNPAERILKVPLPRCEVETNGQVKWNDCKSRGKIVQNICDSTRDFAALQPKAGVDFCEHGHMSATRRNAYSNSVRRRNRRSAGLITYQRRCPCYSPTWTCAACTHSPRRLHW